MEKNTLYVFNNYKAFRDLVFYVYVCLFLVPVSDTLIYLP